MRVVQQYFGGLASDGEPLRAAIQHIELIGYVGSTGNSTGNHLHLEVWKGGSKANAVNPRSYIPMR